MTDPRLIARRDEIESSLSTLAAEHYGVVHRCAGYHERLRPAGRTVKAVLVCLFRDGHIEEMCARCAYGLDAIDIVARVRIRYPRRERLPEDVA